MEITKKVLLALALVAIVTAGAAHAEGWRRGRGCPAWGGACYGPYGGGYGRGYGPQAEGDEIAVPQELREKWAEAQKTEIDLRMELEKNPVNREKALELHAKHRALMQELSDWRFNQRLDALPR